MRILWMSVELPDRQGQGGQRRQFHQIKALSDRGHEITVVSPAAAGPHSGAEQTVQVRRPRLHIKGRAIPFARRRLHSLASENSWDAIVISHLDSIWMLPPAPKAPVLLDLHNVFSSWHDRGGRVSDATAARALEAEGIARADAVTVCSELEEERLRAAHPELASNAFTAPLGVDPAEWPDQVFTRPRPRVALFGGWAWDPNRRGLAWFCDEVWPLVRELVADAEALVAGSGIAADRVLPVGVQSVGRVADLAAFTATASVVAVPVVGGVGAAMKFAESLASGAAVVATPDAANAFPALSLPDSALHVSASPRKWAEWIAARLSARESEQAPASGRDYALNALSWARAVHPIDSWLQSTKG